MPGLCHLESEKSAQLPVLNGMFRLHDRNKEKKKKPYLKLIIADRHMHTHIYTYTHLNLHVVYITCDCIKLLVTQCLKSCGSVDVSLGTQVLKSGCQGSTSKVTRF